MEQTTTQQPSLTLFGKRYTVKQLIYPTFLVLLYSLWFGYMFSANAWHLFQEYWTVSLTMTLGSFVAGATAEGGAAIAFPVFTKVLHIQSGDARTFGLMIQAIGMTAAGLVIVAQGIRILPRVILWASFGGIFGQIIGTFWVALPNPFPKILFTFVAGIFAVALILSRWVIQWEPRKTIGKWTPGRQAVFFMAGVFGGIFAANTGSGIDMLTFIILTLAFGIDEKISTPTTVIIMALNSIVGFALRGLVVQDIGIAWNYWLVAIPIVVLGAPFGAYAASRLNRDSIIKFLISLIALELVTTLWLVPFNQAAIIFAATSVAICIVLFYFMLGYRKRVVLVE